MRFCPRWRWSAIAWLICAVVYVAVLFAWSKLGYVGCAEEPPGSSNYGEASWQWWYPGQRCTFVATTVPGFGSVRAHVEQPSRLSGVVAVGLVAWLIALLVSAISLRSARRNVQDV